MTKPALTCYGGVGTVTGANFLLEVGDKKVLIDCGLFQGLKDSETKEKSKFDYDPALVNFLFITHAHIDHIGRIPDLVLAGFKGVIYSTPLTKEIVELMLHDLVHINGGDDAIVGRVMNLWQTIDYHQSKSFEEFSVELFDAGHILGSSMYKFTFSVGKSILFTGDLGNPSSPLQNEREKVSNVSYILMDSVYGDRNHQGGEVRDAKFTALIEDVIARRSTLLIPIFSLERTQVIVHDLDNLFETKKIQSIPVFLDSPLAIHITEIYKRVLTKGRDDFNFNKFKETAQVRDSMEIAKVPGPKIILAGSGMSTAGRIVIHEQRFLPDPNATILFVGYQAAGTLGRLIRDGAKKVEINGKLIEVRARVVAIDGFSAHADSDQLVEFVSENQETLKKVFITMGEMKSSIFLAQRLKDELNVDSVIPERGKKYELDL
ncbi:MAG: MBL fold metallo-hydrolase [Patescibacteria group bacterium]